MERITRCERATPSRGGGLMGMLEIFAGPERRGMDKPSLKCSSLYAFATRRCFYRWFLTYMFLILHVFIYGAALHLLYLLCFTCFALSQPNRSTCDFDMP